MCNESVQVIYKLDIYKLDIYKLDIYKLDIYKLDIYKLDIYKLDIYKLNIYLFIKLWSRCEAIFLVRLGTSLFPDRHKVLWKII